MQNWLANKIARVKLSDPMSGFFLIKRRIIEEQAPKLTGLGFKILLDIFSSSKNKLNIKKYLLISKVENLENLN